jgi:serine/threonine protein kinase
MGQVYLGRSVAGRLVAVKTIRPELAEEEGFRTRFAQEVAAARRVSGMFTAAVVEADADADVPWLATAYVPAPSLRHMVRQGGPLPPATVRWLAAGCAEALESIHGAGLAHLDLKPSNVLVAADGPRVIDFGVARAATRIGFAKGSAANSRGAVGTPAYMAPEQARDVTQASAASDVFSLGGTLLYAATGHPPYAGETTADILVRLATEPPDLSGLPEELTDLVVPCLDRSPRQRPSSAALLTRLGQFAEPQSYLPEPALALIRDYQRTPRPAGEGSGDGRHAGDNAYWDDEQTAESYPGLPASARPDVPAPSFRSWRRSWRRALHLPTWAGWAAAGAVLVAGGVVLGASLTSSGSPATGQAASGPPPAVALGPGCDQSTPASGTPWLCVSQPRGDPYTVFTVRGSGFAPGTRVTLTLTFYPPPASLGTPPEPLALGMVTVTANGAGGTFSWGPVKSGAVKLGLYRVVASGPRGSKRGTIFRVDPANAP